MTEHDMLTPTTPNVELLRRWQLDLTRRHLRARTIDSYSGRVDVLARTTGPLLEQGTEDLERWLDARHLSAASRLAYLVAFRSFYGWACAHDLVAHDPTGDMVRPKVRPGRPRPVADDALTAALAAATPETRTMILLGVLAGLRVSEIAGLRGEDVDTAGRMLEVVDGKGGKARIVPLHPVLAAALRDLPMPASGPVFLGRFGGPITGHHVGDRIRKVLTVGTAHGLRHRAATAWYAASHDILAVAELLGHEDPRTSRVYARFEVTRAAEVVGAVALPGRWN